MAFLALLCCLASAWALDVPLHLLGANELPPGRYPVRGGLPFAAGTVPSADRLRLQTPAGPLPLQAQTLVTWPDGSVKWALLDFVTPGKLPEQLTLTTASGSASAPPVRATVERTDDVFVVNTGALRAEIPIPRGPLLRAVSLEGGGTILGPGGVDSFVRVHEQKEHTLRTFAASAAAEHTVRIEARGPVRVSVRIEGWHEDGEGHQFAPYVARLHFRAGSSVIEWEHTLIYSGDPELQFIQAAGLLCQVKNECAEQALLPEVKQTFRGPKGECYVLQDSDDHYAAVAGGERAEGQHAGGWLDLSGRAGGMTALLRDFWKLSPKELGAAPASGKLWIGIVPPHSTSVCDWRRYSDRVFLGPPDHETTPELLNRSAQGVARTQQLLLSFHRRQPDVAATKALAASLDHPPLLFASPEYYAATGTLGPYRPLDRESFPRAEAKMGLMIQWYQWSAEHYRWYGLLDYGDWRALYRPDRGGYWYTGGRYGWSNNTGRPLHALFLQYLRTGEREYYDSAEAMAWHVMDVDTIHYADGHGRRFKISPQDLGAGRRQARQHWSGYAGSCYGTNFDGFLDFYLLSGQRRALDVSCECADYLTRQLGAKLAVLGLVRTWDAAKDDPEHSDQAKRFLDRARWAVNETVTKPAQPFPGAPKDWPLGIPYDFRNHLEDYPGLAAFQYLAGDDRLKTVLPQAVRSSWAAGPQTMLDWSFDGLAYALRVQPGDDLVKYAGDAYRAFVPAATPRELPASFRQWEKEALWQVVSATGSAPQDCTFGVPVSGLPYLLQVLNERGLTEEKILGGK